MKRQMSLFGATALVVSSVVPAFAASAETTQVTVIDTRLANGVEIFEKDGQSVFKRYEVFNYNGASPSEFEEHTLKSEFEGLTVLIQEETRISNEDLVVLAQPVEDTLAVMREKANFDIALL
ncbi:MAG: hypothetical protein R3Y64_09650, partial [Peptostreptococcaceae bacterium]